MLIDKKEPLADRAERKRNQKVKNWVMIPGLRPFIGIVTSNVNFIIMGVFGIMIQKKIISIFPM